MEQMLLKQMLSTLGIVEWVYQKDLKVGVHQIVKITVVLSTELKPLYNGCVEGERDCGNRLHLQMST